MPKWRAIMDRNMKEALKVTEIPTSKEIYMLAGWRQWADAGSISSGLPRYLVQQTNARKIGEIHQDGFQPALKNSE